MWKIFSFSWHHANSLSYSHRPQTKIYRCRAPIAALIWFSHHATRRRHDTNILPILQWFHQFLSIWNRNCTIHRRHPIYVDIRPTLWLSGNLLRGYMNYAAQASCNLPAERPSRLVEHCVPERFQRIFPWCIPCSWYFQMPNRIYNRFRAA